MTWWLILTGSLAALIFLLFLGMPIFVAFLLLNVTGVFLLIGMPGFGMFANSIFSTASVGELAAVPLFILMGEMLFRSGAMEVVLDSLDRLVGRIRGRQYVLCVVLSATLGALSGSAMAVATLLGRSLFPIMRNRGYDIRMSLGAILGGSSLAPIIPPSVLAIIIATLAQVSTGQMLIAGILPGLVLAGIFLVYIFIRVRLNPALVPSMMEDIQGTEHRGSALAALIRIIPVTSLFFLVVGLILLGIATPTEAAATGVFGALLLTLYYGRLSWKTIREGFLSAVTVAGMLLIIMACAAMFSQLLTFTGAIRTLGSFIIELQLPGWILLLVMVMVPFVLFMFLDSVSILMVLIPIYQPILGIYDFEPIWFWTLILLVSTVGALSPPFGYTLFSLKSAVPDIAIRDIFSAAWPYVWIIMLGLLLMAIFPEIIMFLPRQMAGS
ncbi:TRAP transporter large permease [Pusillimonas noertemannii]|uniref:TRAP transporter large permease n=1 Tax=Pusillimonas noertemannii TaxID=305977 RepID=UPI0002DD17C4|nr:TRAP transporter large permease subunit [Pusillimonas noertemannii]